MKKIKDFNISRLRTEEDFGFQKQVEAELALLTQEGDAKMAADYVSALNAFDGALKSGSATARTAAVAEADARADAAWSGLNAQVKAVANFPDEVVRAVAAEAGAIVRKYGNITTMPYNEEYGSMHNLLQDLDALGAEKQAKIFINVWVAELHKQYEAFMQASAERTAEESLKVTGIVKQTRTAADEAYRALVERVNALALINGEENYAAFIDRINVLVDKAKATLAARSAK